MAQVKTRPVPVRFPVDVADEVERRLQEDPVLEQAIVLKVITSLAITKSTKGNTLSAS